MNNLVCFQGEIRVAQGAVLDREQNGDIDIQVTAYDSPLDASVRLFTTVTVRTIYVLELG